MMLILMVDDEKFVISLCALPAGPGYMDSNYRHMRLYMCTSRGRFYSDDIGPSSCIAWPTLLNTNAGLKQGILKR